MNYGATLGIRETAVTLGVSIARTYALVWARRLPATKDERGRWQVDATAVEERLRARTKEVQHDPRTA